MICIHPAVASDTKRIEELERDTGLKSYTIPGLSFAVLAACNVIRLPKPKTKRTPSRFNFNGGGDAA